MDPVHRLLIAGYVREVVLPVRPFAKAIVDFQIEGARIRTGAGTIVGVDEVGIGPWAGPVVAAAVCLDAEAIPAGLADSKVLSAIKRQHCFDAIMRSSRVGVGIADVAMIDKDNVLKASQWAMRQAVGMITPHPDLALVDGIHAPEVGCAVETFVGGDARIASIAAASIVAKVTRDRLMAEWAKEFPGYGFERHMGYGTAQHRMALAKLGVTPIHRRSFKPVQAALASSAAMSALQ